MVDFGWSFIFLYHPQIIEKNKLIKEKGNETKGKYIYNIYIFNFSKRKKKRLFDLILETKRERSEEEKGERES